MEDNLQNELEKLQKENEALRSKVDKAKSKEKRKQERTRKTLTWSWKLFTGATLNKSFNNWFVEFHSEKHVSPDTSATLLTALVKRFLRVRMFSVILLLFSIVPSLISLYILIKQNDLIRTQNLLVESSRRSSYSYQLANLYDAIDNKGFKGAKKRIVGLCSVLKPYNYLDEDGHSTVFYSPERTQLLLYLLESNMTKAELSAIFDNTDFSYCDLRNTNLSGKHLSGINLSHSNLKNCELNAANLDNADLTGANLTNIQFSNGWARNTSFKEANLTDARITKAKNISGADFTDATIKNTNFNLSELKDVKGLE
ncbi:pentapeptide repeat-containing protein [uncultured Tenacibaculum sp.]|uniref:pentapeptide repeat-containing protein n=1 Tax=uncultured Tenacibaculum sp. TaxID=174713 RepID=UPI00261EFD44|nr:pentapeptide repeat-containing protein [uncultured Tenacibaculum sp.]